MSQVYHIFINSKPRFPNDAASAIMRKVNIDADDLREILLKGSGHVGYVNDEDDATDVVDDLGYMGVNACWHLGAESMTTKSGSKKYQNLVSTKFRFGIDVDSISDCGADELYRVAKAFLDKISKENVEKVITGDNEFLGSTGDKQDAIDLVSKLTDEFQADTCWYLVNENDEYIGGEVYYSDDAAEDLEDGSVPDPSVKRKKIASQLLPDIEEEQTPPAPKKPVSQLLPDIEEEEPTPPKKKPAHLALPDEEEDSGSSPSSASQAEQEEASTETTSSKRVINKTSGYIDVELNTTRVSLPDIDNPTEYDPKGLVHNKDLIDSFVSIFKYAPAVSDGVSYSKSDYLRAFLALIIADKNTYVVSESSGTVLASSEGEEDHELNGFDLFNKYIGYELGDNNLHKVAYKYNEVQLDPYRYVYQFKSNPKVIDELLLAFAVRLHYKGFFSAAVKMYKQYIAEQDNPRSIDCILVRYYIGLAENECRTSHEQETASTSLNLLSLKADIVKLCQSGIDANPLLAGVLNVAEYQKEFYNYDSLIKNKIDTCPEYNVDNIGIINATYIEIRNAIKKIELPDVVKQIKSNYDNDIEKISEMLEKLEGYDKILKKYFGDHSTNATKLWKMICDEAHYNVNKKYGNFLINESVINGVSEKVATIVQAVNYAGSNKKNYKAISDQLQKKLEEEQLLIEANNKAYQESKKRNQRTKKVFKFFGNCLFFLASLVPLLYFMSLMAFDIYERLTVTLGLTIDSSFFVTLEKIAYFADYSWLIGIIFMVLWHLILGAIDRRDGLDNRPFLRGSFKFSRWTVHTLAIILMVFYVGVGIYSTVVGATDGTETTYNAWPMILILSILIVSTSKEGMFKVIGKILFLGLTLIPIYIYTITGLYIVASILSEPIANVLGNVINVTTSVISPTFGASALFTLNAIFMVIWYIVLNAIVRRRGRGFSRTIGRTFYLSSRYVSVFSIVVASLAMIAMLGTSCAGCTDYSTISIPRLLVVAAAVILAIINKKKKRR